MPRPRHAATAPQAPCVPPGALLPAPRGMPARPRMHAPALAAACTPRPWLLRARPGLACCVLAQALPAECPWGAALALAAACPCLGCVPMGGCLHACPGLGCLPMGGCLGLGCCMPMPWQPAHGGCLGLGCCTPWAGTGHPRGMPACTPRRIAPHRPALQQNWLVPFSIFVSLNSFHDFRGGFQQAVWRSERF